MIIRRWKNILWTNQNNILILQFFSSNVMRKIKKNEEKQRAGELKEWLAHVIHAFKFCRNVFFYFFYLKLRFLVWIFFSRSFFNHYDLIILWRNRQWFELLTIMRYVRAIRNHSITFEQCNNLMTKQKICKMWWESFEKLTFEFIHLTEFFADSPC